MEPRNLKDAMQAQAMAYGQCAAPMDRPRVTTRDLMTLAEGIAAQVAATVPRGPQRCTLREMVEMFLNGHDHADR